MSDATARTRNALLRDLDEGPWLTLRGLADWEEEQGNAALAGAFRWLAEHRKWPLNIGDIYTWGSGPDRDQLPEVVGRDASQGNHPDVSEAFGVAAGVLVAYWRRRGAWPDEVAVQPSPAPGAYDSTGVYDG